ncbi:MAG: hypothetical protein KDI44_07300 [Thiothrix sp.]|nr:hypothetical protein [Thiothrix sp.]HPQ96334.1 hypothetical protein [Thiolinea sp.]
MLKPFALLAALLPATGLTDNLQPVAPPTTPAQLYSIERLCVAAGSTAGTHTVTLEATASSSGWSAPQLLPYVYVRQPDDGVQDYGLVARPPQGVALTVLSPLKGAMVLTTPGWMKGIRVHTDRNALQFLFDSTGGCVSD